MNSQFSVKYSSWFAERVRTLAGDDARAQSKQAWRLAFGREPTSEQADASANFIAKQTKHYEQIRRRGDASSPRRLALASFCQALISSNMFLYVD